MTTAELNDIRSAALRLPEDERVKLAHDLLVSLHEHMDSDVAAAWDIEICRRINEIKSGKADLCDVEEVIARAKARIGS